MDNEKKETYFKVFSHENFIDLTFYQFGKEQCVPLHSYGPYVRNHYLFHYVLSGTGYLDSTDPDGISHKYQIRSGQGFLITPRYVNTYFADKDYPWEYMWIEFDGLQVREALSMAGLDAYNPIYRSNNREILAQLRDTMLNIIKNADETPLYLIGQGFLFLDYLTKSSSSRRILSGAKMKDFYIKEALSFIEQNFQNDISIEDIANVCRLDRSYFGKIFKNSMGKSPQAFLMSYRMSKATQLLSMTKLSVSDIGNAVGYPNRLHFSRAFKTVLGISPQKWREKHNSI